MGIFRTEYHRKCGNKCDQTKIFSTVKFHSHNDVSLIIVFQVTLSLTHPSSQANVAETGEVVAIKKVYQDKRYKNRELQIMKELFHPNVITLKHAFYTQGDKVLPPPS